MKYRKLSPYEKDILDALLATYMKAVTESDERDDDGKALVISDASIVVWNLKLEGHFPTDPKYWMPSVK